MKPNVLFIVIDSLRSDMCRGVDKSSKTPNIDNLINNGIYFEQAISSIASTGSSMSTIFTGLFPFKTGMSGGAYEKLDPKIKTYIKGLKEFGYHNYSTSPELASLLGLTCDFENKDKSYQNYFGLFSGLGPQIIEKLQNNSFEKPWFFYIHLIDLHSPIVVPKEFDNAEFGSSQYEKMLSAIDFWIGQFLENVNLDDTLVILTADHGDYVPLISNKSGQDIDFQTSKFEKTIWEIGNRLPKSFYPIKKSISSILHSCRQKIKKSKIDSLDLSPYQKRVLTNSRMGTGHHIYDDVLRVPLIFNGYSIASPKLISQQVRHVDIFPTISEIINYTHGKSVDGISLLPIIEGKKVDEFPNYIESMPRLKQENQQKIGIRTSEYKYFRNLDGDKSSVELYDLELDPLEENNIAEKNLSLISKLENTLLEIHQNILSNNTDDEEKKKIEEELKKLGYI